MPRTKRNTSYRQNSRLRVVNKHSARSYTRTRSRIDLPQVSSFSYAPDIRFQSPKRTRSVRIANNIPRVFQPTAFAKKPVVASRASAAKRLCAARRNYKGQMMKSLAAQVKRTGHSLSAWRDKRSQNRQDKC
ncbi:hypothetical protein [Microviridae sp.]|nr:hypothetical protein [Microviridae sp.]